MKKIQNLLYICLFLALSFSLGAQNLDPRDSTSVVHGLRELTGNAFTPKDNTGITANQKELEDLQKVSNELFELVKGIATNFKVFDYGSYPMLTQMGKEANNDAMFAAMEAQVALMTPAVPYYLLIGRHIDSESGKVSFKVKLGLPVTTSREVVVENTTSNWDKITNEHLQELQKEYLYILLSEQKKQGEYVSNADKVSLEALKKWLAEYIDKIAKGKYIKIGYWYNPAGFPFKVNEKATGIIPTSDILYNTSTKGAIFSWKTPTGKEYESDVREDNKFYGYVEVEYDNAGKRKRKKNAITNKYVYYEDNSAFSLNQELDVNYFKLKSECDWTRLLTSYVCPSLGVPKFDGATGYDVINDIQDTKKNENPKIVGFLNFNFNDLDKEVDFKIACGDNERIKTLLGYLACDKITDPTLVGTLTQIAEQISIIEKKYPKMLLGYYHRTSSQFTNFGDSDANKVDFIRNTFYKTNRFWCNPDIAEITLARNNIVRYLSDIERLNRDVNGNLTENEILQIFDRGLCNEYQKDKLLYSLFSYLSDEQKVCVIDKMLNTLSSNPLHPTMIGKKIDKERQDLLICLFESIEPKNGFNFLTLLKNSSKLRTNQTKQLINELIERLSANQILSVAIKVSQILGVATEAQTNPYKPKIYHNLLDAGNITEYTLDVFNANNENSILFKCPEINITEWEIDGTIKKYTQTGNFSEKALHPYDFITTFASSIKSSNAQGFIDQAFYKGCEVIDEDGNKTKVYVFSALLFHAENEIQSENIWSIIESSMATSAFSFVTSSQLVALRGAILAKNMAQSLLVGGTLATDLGVIGINLNPNIDPAVKEKINNVYFLTGLLRFQISTFKYASKFNGLTSIYSRLGKLKNPNRPLLKNENMLVDNSHGLQSHWENKFSDIVYGSHGEKSTTYLWTIDERGVNVILETTPFPTPRGNVVHSNISSKAYIAGEMWFKNADEIVMNAGSGRFGDGHPEVTVNTWQAATNFFEKLGYKVEAIPLGKR